MEVIDLPIEKRTQVEEDLVGSLAKSEACGLLGAPREGDWEIDAYLRHVREHAEIGILGVVRHGARSVWSLLQ